MTFATLLYETQGRIACITLNRPERLNAADRDMHRDLATVWRAIDEDSGVNAVILRGGSEAIRSNVAIAGILRGALAGAGLPEDAASPVPRTDRAAIDVLDSAVARGAVLLYERPEALATHGDALRPWLLANARLVEQDDHHVLYALGPRASLLDAQ